MRAVLGDLVKQSDDPRRRHAEPARGAPWLRGFACGLLVAVSLAGGCVQVDLDIRELRRTVRTPELSFSDVSALAGQELSETRQFNAKLDQTLIDYLAFAAVTKLRLLPEGEVDDLSFIKRASLTLVGDDELPDAVLARIEPEVDRPAEDGSLLLRIDDRVDPTAYIKRGLPYQIDLQMQVPPGSWSIAVDIAVDLGLEAAVELL